MILKNKERIFVEQLRKETAEVKSCFNRYTFQGLSLSTATLVLIFSLIKESPFIVFVVIPVIILLMIICRIGIFKYSTANRHFGYELHLSRINNLLQSGIIQQGMADNIRHIRWEEALRAWRVIQVKIFRKIYQVPQNHCFWRFLNKIWIISKIQHLIPWFYKYSASAKEVINSFIIEKKTAAEAVPEANGNENGNIQNAVTSYPWFDLSVLTLEDFTAKCKRPSLYYGGAYLKDMLAVLFLMQYLLLIPLLFVSIPNEYIVNPPELLLDSSRWTLIVFILLIFLRQIRITRRRKILESGLLSIHSCAILWNAIAIAHLEALTAPLTYAHYTERLIELAKEISKNVYNIHTWIDTKM